MELKEIKGNTAIAQDNDIVFVLRFEEDEKLRRLSGWYISRIYNNKTFYWQDFASPGWGATYWINQKAAENLGLTRSPKNQEEK